MTDPKSGDTREYMALWLASEAHDAIKRGEVEMAVHRLVDAAGLCARVAQDKAEERGVKFRLIGFTEQTGRGFQVKHVPCKVWPAKPKRKEAAR